MAAAFSATGLNKVYRTGETEALDLVDLADPSNLFPAQLSNGEQQRAAVGRAIAKRPSVQLCDEPAGAPESKAGVRI